MKGHLKLPGGTKVILQTTDVFEVLGRKVTIGQVYIKEIPCVTGSIMFYSSYIKKPTFHILHGVAFCNPDDKYDAIEGVLKSTGRAVKPSKTLDKWNLSSHGKIGDAVRIAQRNALKEDIKKNPGKYFVHGKNKPE